MKTTTLEFEVGRTVRTGLETMARRKGITVEQQVLDSLKRGLAIAAVAFAGGEVEMTTREGKKSVIDKNTFTQ